MKGHWIPPAPRGFIDRIAAKLGYSKTIPSGLGTDLVDAVGTLNDHLVDLATLKSGTAYISGNAYTVYKYGKIVLLNIYVPNGLNPTTSWATVGSLPNGFLSNQTFYVLDQFNPDEVQWAISGRDILIKATRAISNTWGSLVVSYATN